MATPIRRTDSVKIKLSPDLIERLEVMAQQYGMPISTMAAFGVADFLLKHENAAKAVKMATLAVARESVPTAELLERLAPDLIAQVSKAFMQPNLPLDGEATVEGV